MNNEKCPICRNFDGGYYKEIPGSRNGHDCSICGEYVIDIYTKGTLVTDTRITNIHRALISHQARLAYQNKYPLGITNDWLNHIIENGSLPTPKDQANNLVRFIGDEVSRTGVDMQKLPNYIHAVIGAPRLIPACELAKELRERGLLRLNADGETRKIAYSTDTHIFPTDINLTLDGWEQYALGQQGKADSDYGFLAMQFNDKDLENFVRDILKPTVKKAIGCDLRDIRDNAKAGIIDNIIRDEIRRARFAIVDLTHDNNGAYWEAGYAEGLGKPVIYICEQEKFDAEKTHFDTNHCTTVPWSRKNDEYFQSKLTATLHQSLDILK